MVSDAAKRVTEFRTSLGLTQQDFANELGTSRGTVGSTETAEGDPSKGFLKKLYDRYGVSTDWVLTGQGTPIQDDGAGFPARRDSLGTIAPVRRAGPGKGDFRIDDNEFALLCRFEIGVAPGPGMVQAKEPSIAVSSLWLARKGISADLAGILEVIGDSMAPTIPDGALVLVHRGEMRLDRDGIYAYAFDGAVFIRRLRIEARTPAGDIERIAVLSDNPAYEPQVIERDRLYDINIAGRVRAVISTLD